LVASGNISVFCSAYVVVGRHLETIDKYFEYFKSDAAERMLVIVVQDRKYIKPFIKVSLASVSFASPKPPPTRRNLATTDFCNYTLCVHMSR
jgi:hypothetical protein